MNGRVTHCGNRRYQNSTGFTKAFQFLVPSELLTLAEVCKLWAFHANSIAVWTPFLAKEFETMPPDTVKTCNPRHIWVRLKMRKRFMFYMEGLNFVRVDLASRTSIVEKTLTYSPMFIQLRNGKIFFCGGSYTDGNRIRAKRDVWLYDPKTHTSESFVDLSEEKTGVALVEMNGAVYAFGGARKGYNLRSANRFILKSREKEYLPYLPRDMKNPSAIAHNGNIYLCHTPRLEIMRFDPKSHFYKHVVRAADKNFSSILLNVHIGNQWALIVSRNSQLVDLEQQTRTQARVTANAVPKKYVSPVHEYRDAAYFLARNDSGSLYVWQVRICLPGTVAITSVGEVSPATPLS